MTPADVIARVDRLELLARQVVEGTLAGRHKSPRTGFAVEFAQHREYAPGDDTRHLDWKVFARTGRYHLKQYEQETNLVCWLVVDASESMRVGTQGLTKYDAASALAAALAYLVTQQGDSVGLATLGARGEVRAKASASTGQFREVVRALARGPARGAGDVGRSLLDLGGLLGRRGVVFLLGDFLDPADTYAPGLRLLKSHRHDLALFQVLDPAELEFPFRDPTLFEGLEGLPNVTTDPASVRDVYLDGLRRHLAELDALCKGHAVDAVRLTTDADLGSELAGYLYRRRGTVR